MAEVDGAELRRLLAVEFERRGWEYDLTTGTALVRAVSEAERLDATTLVHSVPASFLRREGVSRDDVAVAIESVLAELRAPSVRGPQLRLLFIAASPLNEERLRLDAEHRDIRSKVRSSSGRDRVAIEAAIAARPTDLIDEFNRFQPTVVHLAGHGGPTGVVLEDEAGMARELTTDQLRELVSVASDGLRLVVLNACESSDLARPLLASVDSAISMSRDVDDDSARAFAAQLYSSLADGVPLGTAFTQAKLQVSLAGLSGAGVPALFARPGADAIQFVELSD